MTSQNFEEYKEQTSQFWKKLGTLMKFLRNDRLVRIFYLLRNGARFRKSLLRFRDFHLILTENCAIKLSHFSFWHKMIGPLTQSWVWIITVFTYFTWYFVTGFYTANRIWSWTIWRIIKLDVVLAWLNIKFSSMAHLKQLSANFHLTIQKSQKFQGY